MKFVKSFLFGFFVAGIFVFNVDAQVLGSNETMKVNKGASLKAVLGDFSQKTEDSKQKQEESDALLTQKPSKEDLKDGEFFIPAGEIIKLGRQTNDGTKRGGAAVFEVDNDGEGKVAAKIFLYYDNFRIARSINGLTTCDVRFFILSTLDSRLISFDAKLVWPEISTAISFANVMPNTPTYYNYTLIGDGCYTMDKMPNIIVNRCRVKGFSSAECANRIVWLSETK